MGPGRVAIRISPTTMDPKNGRENAFYNGPTSDPDEIFPYAVNELNKHPLAYVLLTEPRWTPLVTDGPDTDPGFNLPLVNVGKFAPKNDYRKIYKGTLMGGGGFIPTSAAKTVEDGDYDLTAFGRWFISNPDLPERIRTGAPLNVYDRRTFGLGTVQGGDYRGYSDYPDMAGTVKNPGNYELIEQERIGRSLATAKPKL